MNRSCNCLTTKSRLGRNLSNLMFYINVWKMVIFKWLSYFSRSSKDAVILQCRTLFSGKVHFVF